MTSPKFQTVEALIHELQEWCEDKRKSGAISTEEIASALYSQSEAMKMILISRNVIELIMTKKETKK